MFDKIKYKVWKHLNKQMEARIKKEQKQELDQKSEEKPAVSFQERIVSDYKYIISCYGFNYSGSSTLIGFLREFDNTTVIGNIENLYSKQTSVCNSKVNFFSDSGLLNLTDAFGSGTVLQKDAAIKRFIASVYRGFDNKGVDVWEYIPQFYTQEFLDNSMRFLTSVLDLDDHTLSFMKNKRFPVMYNSKDDTFKNCSFLHHQGIGAYVLYRFKEMSPETFKTYATDYIRSLFRLLPSKEFYCFDKLAPWELLEKLKAFADAPIKQICVRRDPRDQFLLAFRSGELRYMPVTIDDFVDFYQNRFGLKDFLKNPHPDRLLIRFEDIVLKYDETTKKIMDFIGMDASHHINPKAFFDPSLSAVNIGAYKYFEDQDFMRRIEERLGEYCYYPEKENLSEEAWDLLKANNFAS